MPASPEIAAQTGVHSLFETPSRSDTPIVPLYYRFSGSNYVEVQIKTFFERRDFSVYILVQVRNSLTYIITRQT